MSEISDIVATTIPKYPCISRIGVFGSYARGDFDSTSDIDILYDYNPNVDDFDEQVLGFVEDFLDKIEPMRADFIFYESLVAKDNDFKENALADVKWLYRA